MYIPFVPMTPASVRFLSLAHGPRRRQFISFPRTAFCIGPEVHFRRYTYYMCIILCVYATVDDANNTHNMHNHMSTCVLVYVYRIQCRG